MVEDFFSILEMVMHYQF